MGQRGRRWAVRAATLTAVVLLAASCQTPTGGGSGPGLFQFNPANADPAIRSEPLAPSFSYAPAGTPRGELAVLFNGTGAGPLALSRLGAQLSAAGFHVIGLRYESGVGTLAACPDSVADSFPDCHRAFRGEVVHGAGVPDVNGDSFDHPSVDVSAANSVMNRLLEHVEYMRVQAPTMGWEQFQVRSGGACAEVNPEYGACELDWQHVVALGHSQGAGVALYLGKLHPLTRVAMLSGAYDAFRQDDGSYVAAPWVSEGGFQVPVSRLATFSHLSDPAIAIHRAVATQLGIPGPEVLVTTTPRPYGSSGRLVTNATPVCPLDSAPSHNSTATDLCSPAVHDQVWRYLATGE